MVREALFDRVAIPAGHVHPVPTELGDAATAAAAYEKTLMQLYGAAQRGRAKPLFAATLLGIGEDGHTASLFPGQPALDETRRWAVAVRGAKKETRITLTYPALQSGRHAAFLATGAEKRDAVRRARAGDRALPAARLRPAGELQWFVDRAAAGA
jgi:6-phosphogluconolactonase